MKTIIRFLDADLINDIVTLMIGIKQVEIKGSDYRILNSLAKDWRSGLELVSGKSGRLFKFNSDNSYRIEGRASANIVMKILNK
ncbi:hypothetical protein [uncultured Parabacteroides sp.]|jgi:hypothetical protein|uniref:hypothetical protein n=1 Tax=uncultured Parabacteroides sp. TaxID=512312 RepID=UPI0025DB75A7|nr:hypothetical protein [uncultured Parabacteroides sp.]